MTSQVFDNIQVTSLLNLLEEQVTLQRFYPLITHKEQIISTLLALGIRDKYQYFGASQELRKAFVQKTDLSLTLEAMFVQFLHLYDFKPRRLSDAREIGLGIELTGNKAMKTSENYLSYCMNYGLKEASKMLNLTEDGTRELFSLCDLMRLPGVKWLRAKLYYDCGYQSIQSFSQNDNEQVRNKIALYIQTNCLERGVPLPKEIATQIAVARALPHLNIEETL